MFNKSYEENKTQNQFTAYLKSAVHNCRIRYLMNKSKSNDEIPFEEIEIFDEPNIDFMQELADYEVIQQALKSIKEKERRIVIARIIEEKNFDEIATELGMTYKAVTSLYYRVLKRMKQQMEGNGELK